nr:metallophosphoesterase [Rhodococcus sp. (in: high G+C Gram-positive bacteria)]
MKLLLISDLHAFTPSKEVTRPPSYLEVGRPEDSAAMHPFADLLNFIELHETKLDYVVCCGDISDRADPAGTQYSWRWLNRIKDATSAERLLIVSGNHDLDSRHQHNKFDARGMLQSLTPQYPLTETELADKYWARNFVILDDTDYRILLINTSAYHGTAEEYMHGRISDRTSQAIEQELDSMGHRNLNIAICHHHPVKFGSFDNQDNSEIRGAEKLLSILDDGPYGDWVFLHGHRHFPDILYAQGGARSPIIFSAGSFSATLHDEISSRTNNQFYIIDLEIDPDAGTGVQATFEAWDWIPNVGIQTPNSKNAGLPNVGGFGNRSGGIEMASQIAEFYDSADERFIEWDELCSAIPQIRYLMPRDLRVCLRSLRETHDFKIHTDEDSGQIAQLGKKK